jgi:sortase (surface protein transpeptidase)
VAHFSYRRGIYAIVPLTAALLGGSAFSATPANAATLSPPHRTAHSRHASSPTATVKHGQAEHGQAKKALTKPKTANTPKRWTLDVPSIGVSAKLLTFATHQGGDLPVPALTQAEDPAWYKFTATPGTPGNAVIVGHVDTYIGPGVFYDLYLLVPGNTIYVTTGAGREAFRVTSVAELPKPDFPVNKVFGPTKSRRLWLITCGGDFDYTTRHYLDNIIVSAIYTGHAKNLR